MKVVNITKYFILCFFLFVFSCSKSASDEENENLAFVRVMFNPNGIGDLSYNDAVLRGILEKQKELGFRMQYICPENEQDGINIIHHWMKEESQFGQYVVLVGDQLQVPAREVASAAFSQNYLFSDMDLPGNTSPAFRFCGYGVSYLAGIAAYTITQSDSAIYIAGKSNDNYLEDAYHGFKDGFIDAGGSKVPIIYLSDGGEGFRNPARGYELADSLSKLYPFIYSMAGGTNSGIYKYFREFPGTNCYTAGVDLDQSMYTDQIIGSAIKDVGKCTGMYIESWMNGEQLPLKQYWDLSSEFIYFKVAEKYRSQLENILNDKKPFAIEKEEQYEIDNRPTYKTR